MRKLAVVAFGGNALLRSGQKGTYEEQLLNVENTCESLCALLKRNYNIVIGHGNGPQVGNVMLQHEAGKLVGVQAMPMDFCVAETQGSIAYLIEMGLPKVVGVVSIDWDKEEDLTMWYLDIPVFARFSFVPMFHFDFGAYFAFNLYSSIHYKYTASYEGRSAPESGDVDITEVVKTFDAGLLAGAGVSILPGMLDIDFRLALGFAGVDLADENAEAVWVNHLRMQLGATFWFL